MQRARAFTPRGERCIWWIIGALGPALGCNTIGKSLHVGDEPEEHEANQPVARDSGASTPEAGLDAAPAAPLSVSIQNAAAGELNSLAFSCLGACTDLYAVAQGGTPPYSFRWEDGSTGAARHICPASTIYSVHVSDSATPAPELDSELHVATAQLATRALACADAGPDSGPNAPANCHPDPEPSCTLASGASLPDEVTVDVPGVTAQYFAGGAALPAGRYRLTYIDGCNTYGLEIGWSVHAQRSVPGAGTCSLVGGDGVPFALTPGTELYPDQGTGEVPTYQQCVDANCLLPPLDFDFAGGKLGVLRDGGGTLGAIDDAPGEEVGGRSPTFRLSMLDPCP